MLRINCEAVIWKITTRGFTLEQVLIMAAMNPLTSADTAAKRERNGRRRNEKEINWRAGCIVATARVRQDRCHEK